MYLEKMVFGRHLYITKGAFDVISFNEGRKFNDIIPELVLFKYGFFFSIWKFGIAVDIGECSFRVVI